MASPTMTRPGSSVGTSWTGSPKMDTEKEKELVKEFDALDVSDSGEKGEKEKDSSKSSTEDKGL